MEAEQALDADELLNLADRIEQLPPGDAEWVRTLFQECLRARMHEAELLAGTGASEAAEGHGNELEAQLAQVALDAAEWLKTLWTVGYMGAGSFPSQPRSAFPLIELEDVLKSALFARIREGKRPLPFPPPTRNGSPWHDLIENREGTYDVQAEIVRDENGTVVGAIIEGCPDWHVIEELAKDREYMVQHRGQGPRFRLMVDAFLSTLQREPPRWERRIRRQERGGFCSYTLEWQHDDGRHQSIPLRAATWERAESEANHWIANSHPKMYGQVSFERCE